jgi:hypothetical protein
VKTFGNVRLQRIEEKGEKKSILILRGKLGLCAKMEEKGSGLEWSSLRNKEIILTNS